MKRELLSATGLAFLCACSAGAGNTSDTGNRGTDSWDPVDDTSTIDTATPDFARLRLSGALELVDGQITTGTVFYTLHEAGETEMSCTQEHRVATASQLASTEPDWVMHWAELSLQETEVGCGVSLPLEMRVGLGKLYYEVVPLLDKYGVAESKDSLQGFYAALPAPLGKGLDGEVFAMGYGGTSAALAGEGEAQDEAPFPDGLYLIESVYFLQLP